MPIAPAQREAHHRWLLALTQIPTAAGKEHGVIDWVTRWVAERPELELTRDSAGNLHIVAAERGADAGPPVYFTAHMDHPAFTVERVLAPGAVQVGFRGGVLEPYFSEARIAVHTEGGVLGGTLTQRLPAQVDVAFPQYLAELDAGSSEVAPEVGDIATWELPPAFIEQGLIHTHACDDLAALAAALAAFDALIQERKGAPGPHTDVRVLLTRAEEVGFIGAIAACREGTMPRDARVIALENSRSFDDSPIGGGPIVRVGDRLSVFSPNLTAAIARRAEEVAGGAGTKWKWQRKLMAGGACEATVFCTSGYEATCLCLPLGNYHNMADLAAVQAGTNTSPARIGPEFISLSDFDGLVDLLVACGQKLEPAPSVRERIDKLWNEKAFVLGD